MLLYWLFLRSSKNVMRKGTAAVGDVVTGVRVHRGSGGTEQAIISSSSEVNQGVHPIVISKHKLPNKHHGRRLSSCIGSLGVICSTPGQMEMTPCHDRVDKERANIMMMVICES